MRVIRQSFLIMFTFIRQDKMLFAASFAPVLTGLFFRFGIPALDSSLMEWLSLPAVLAPFYGLFDLFLAMLTAVMFCFIAAMVILEERDEHIDKYLFSTPLGQWGYLASRLGIPTLAALLITLTLLPLFKLTDISLLSIIALATAGSLQGVITSLLIITISSNKLEGMAVTKLSTVTILGAIVPYFIHNPAQYTVSLLPSFWIGKALYEGTPFCLLLSILLSLLWIMILMKYFLAKKQIFTKLW